MSTQRVLAKVALAAIASIILAVTLHFPLKGFQKQEEGKGLPQEKDGIQLMEGFPVFQAYCAACHGRDAKGDGPAASSFKTKLPDLTRISQRNGGIFPFYRVQRYISGADLVKSAHGSRDMPVWGPIFDDISWDGAPGSIRIYNLTRYIQSLQQK